MSYIRNVEKFPNIISIKNIYPDNVVNTMIKDEKYFNMVALKMMKYIYEKNIDIKNCYESYENYFNSATKHFRALLPEEETRLKKLIKNFDKNFEDYKNVPCLEILQNFSWENPSGSNNYIDNGEQKDIFDFKSYLELISNKDGSLKPVKELENLPNEKLLELNNAIRYFADYINACPAKSENSVNLQIGR